jgi:hypothetical protein
VEGAPHHDRWLMCRARHGSTVWMGTPIGILLFEGSSKLKVLVSTTLVLAKTSPTHVFANSWIYSDRVQLNVSGARNSQPDTTPYL